MSEATSWVDASRRRASIGELGRDERHPMTIYDIAGFWKVVDREQDDVVFVTDSGQDSVMFVDGHIVDIDVTCDRDLGQYVFESSKDPPTVWRAVALDKSEDGIVDTLWFPEDGTKWRRG